MSESQEVTIQRLLREGLDLYGADEVSAAIVTWQKVLEIDPDNAEALDYLSTADRRQHPRDPAPNAGPSTTRTSHNVTARAAGLLLRQGDFAAAVGLLESITGPDSHALDHQAILDLSRGCLYADLCERVGHLDRVPRACGEAGDPKQWDLPANAGLVLSMIDGEICLEDLVALSGMDALDALQAVCDLLDAGVVEMEG